MKHSSATRSARTVERAQTADGGVVAMLRRSGPRDPVILLHGIAVNADIWDLPDIRGDDFHYRSLATLLHEAGFDVWLPNLRGHGWPHAYSTPPPGLRDWCVDHFIHFDVPAIVAHVRAATGRTPFLGGCSMGAMCVAAHLQGARLSGPRGAQRIGIDESAARERQAEVAGAVLVEFPAALSWPRSCYGEAGFRPGALLGGNRRDCAESNFVFEILARRWLLVDLLEALGEIRLHWLRVARDAGERRARLWRPARGTLDACELAFARGFQLFARLVKGEHNFNPQTFSRGLRVALDHIKAGVLRQFAACVRGGNFVSLLGAAPHVYSDHYERIHCPVITALGGRDRIANAAVTRAVFHERIASPDKTLLYFENLGHGEFEYSPLATTQVFPRIVEWIEQRARVRA